MPTMIDLKATYGDTYRITLDDSTKIPDQSQADRLWLYRIPARYGHIYVHGVNTLGGFTDRPKIATRLMALDGVKTHQHGDREVTVIFTPDRLPAVAELLQAKRRWYLDPERKAAAVARCADMNERRRRKEGRVPEGVSKEPRIDRFSAPDASAERGTVDPSSSSADRS
jgi:hypothetical protein